jgi:serine/threonine-protein kinase
VADVPPELDLLCVRATALHRDDRIASARELGETLQRYLDGDRDVALRKDLARQHLAAALAAGDDEDGRRVAMREAGRALALDPMLAEAADLISRLMIEPPKVMPAQVRAELDQLDRVTTRRFTFNLVFVHSIWFVVLPLLYVLGLRDTFYVGAFAIAAIVGLTAAVVDLRLGYDLTWVHNTIMLGFYVLVARVMTPFLIAPAIIMVNVVAFAFHPTSNKPSRFALFTVASVLTMVAVWLAEVIGLVAPTMTFQHGVLMIQPPLDGIGAVPVIEALAVYIPLSVAGSALLAYATAKVARVARERVHLQAWQVRQLVPERRP